MCTDSDQGRGGETKGEGELHGCSLLHTEKSNK